jgi:hypothetical protein
MDAIVLKNVTDKGEPLEVSFLPHKGMNMISFRKGNIEVIDQSTRESFEYRFAGLGALIGPHFHRRLPEVVPKGYDESLFPHIARVKSQGILDPFSHGISRYAPWKTTRVEQAMVSAVLSGKDTWNGIPLEILEGQNFRMSFSARLEQDGLYLHISVVSDYDSLIGLHYYYHLPEGRGTVVSTVQNTFIENKQRKPLRERFPGHSQQSLHCDLKEAYDCTFFPFPDPLEGKILLDAGAYRLETTYSSSSQENSWQLYHPAGASYVCIEPLSAQDPHHPNLSVSSLMVHLRIL